MKIILTMIKGELAGKTYTFDKKAIIGRTPKAQVFIDDELVSRKHAEIFVKHNTVFIKDLKSAGGTYLNSQVITETCKLKSRDKIRIANSIFEIKILKPKKPKAISLAKPNIASLKLGRTLSDIAKTDTEQIDTIPVAVSDALNENIPEKHEAPKSDKANVYQNQRSKDAQDQAIEIVTKYRGIKQSKKKFNLKDRLGFFSMYFDEMPFWMQSLFVAGIIGFAIFLIYFGFSLFDTKPPEIPDKKDMPIFIPYSNQKIFWPESAGYLQMPTKSPFQPHNVIKTFTECFIVDFNNNEITATGVIDTRGTKKLIVFPGAVITNAYRGAEFIRIADYNGDVCTLTYGLKVEVTEFGVFSPISDDRETVLDKLAEMEEKLADLEKTEDTDSPADDKDKTMDKADSAD